MIFENEKQILKIIKYTPSLFIVAISLLIVAIQFNESNKKFIEEKEKIQLEFTQKNKKVIKQRVYEVYNYIKREQKFTEEALKKSLKMAVNNATAIANTLYENNKHKDTEEIKKLIVDALRNIRFNNNRGYFFIYENNGKNLLLPHNEHLEGKNFWNHQDAKGTYIIQEMSSNLKNKNEIFYDWYWYNPTKPDKQRKKLGLIRKFEPFNWLIGTGEYIEDYEKEVQEKLLKNIREIRFGDNGYIFIITFDSIYLSHVRKKYLGKKAITNMDTVEIKKVINDLIKISKNGEGYYNYIQSKKPGTEKATEKISFVKGLDNWQWMIGTGFYLDDMKDAISQKKEELDKNFKDYFYKTLKVTIISTLILLIFSFYFSKLLHRKFAKYKKEIKQHIKENDAQHHIMAQQSKMAAMGEMLSNIAHQWRQPLSTISTSATGIKLQKEMGVLDDDFLIEGLEGINNSTQYLSSTIDDFRNFFKRDKEKKLISARDVLEKSIALVYTQFQNKNIKIILNEEDVKVKCYENELKQVIINLLNNSKDELVKKDENFRKLIFLNIHKENNNAIIQIKDNAEGIPEKIIDRIFEPYFTTKHKAKGTGIGLYMSREIITRNINGKIEVTNTDFSYENKNYSGALFTITLPIT